MKNTEEQIILLIEDNPGDSRLIKEMLKEITFFNYQLIVAETLKAGCEQIKKNNFILILLDLNLPDSTGNQTFDTVIKFAEKIPVVLVSGLHDVELSLSLIEKGAQDYILKQDLNSRLLGKTIQYALIRKQAEKELKASWDYLNNIINSVASPIFVKDDKHNLCLVNTAFCEMLNRSPDQLLGKTDFENFPTDQVEVYLTKDKEVLITGKENINEEQLTDGTGQLRTIVTRKTLYTDNAGNKFLVGVINDITERKKAEVELTLAKEKAEESALLNKFALDLYNNSENFDIDKIIRLSLEKAIELTKSEIGFFHFVNPDQETISLQVWSAKTMKMCDVPTKVSHYPISKAGIWVDCLKERKPIIHNDYENLLHKKGLPEGHTPIIREATIPVFEGEKVIAVLGVGNKKNDYTLHDIELLTNLSVNYWNIIRRKRTEIDLIKAKEKAEESEHLKTAFLQNMSHEIRTPLNAISGFSGMLNKPELSEEKRKNFVSIIQNSGKQLISIVSDILTISSLETKQEKVNIQKVCINSIILDLLAIFKQQTQNQNISLYAKQQLSDKQSEIYTDKTKITQILTNLISNALKFTHEGFIQFGYNLVEPHCGVALQTELQFYIKDTGIGIKPEFHEKIFERFRQADKSINKLYGGTGLGLSISKGFVELLGGIIWVQSELDKGSIFYFTIPYKPVHEIDKANSPTIQNENFPTVLVAEDDEYNFLYIEELLIEMDFKIIHAKDGKSSKNNQRISTGFSHNCTISVWIRTRNRKI